MWAFFVQENSVGETNVHKSGKHIAVSSGMVCHGRIYYLSFVSQWKKKYYTFMHIQEMSLMQDCYIKSVFHNTK